MLLTVGLARPDESPRYKSLSCIVDGRGVGTSDQCGHGMSEFGMIASLRQDIREMFPDGYRGRIDEIFRKAHDEVYPGPIGRGWRAYRQALRCG